MTSAAFQLEVGDPQCDGTFPTEVFHGVSSTDIEVQCSKNFKKFEIISEVKV